MAEEPLIPCKRREARSYREQEESGRVLAPVLEKGCSGARAGNKQLVSVRHMSSCGSLGY